MIGVTYENNFFGFFLPFFCHSKEVLIYTKEVQKAIDKTTNLCLGETEWPASNNDNSIWVNARMESLVDSGLIKSNLKGKNKTWTLTDLGKKEYNKNGDFCYGRMMVKEILNITYINKKKGFIVFNYYIHSLPNWARNKSIRFAYTYLDNIILGINTEKYQIDFEKTNTGMIKIISDPVQVEILY
ncbi:CpmK protein [Photorhabdus sp. CRCIA-P01]|uniref:CpmK protein n=1 Tax=Photorhabdus sp. CRCIA-P01 TaxID=2019570 RepID=UPI000E59E928|nr:CpmK protein [Photorhabdus sp. CRCIA-P01]